MDPVSKTKQERYIANPGIDLSGKVNQDWIEYDDRSHSSRDNPRERRLLTRFLWQGCWRLSLRLEKLRLQRQAALLNLSFCWVLKWAKADLVRNLLEDTVVVIEHWHTEHIKRQISWQNQEVAPIIVLLAYDVIFCLHFDPLLLKHEEEIRVLGTALGHDP